MSSAMTSAMTPAISDLIQHGADRGLGFRISNNFAEMAEQRRLLRGSEVSPMFDPLAAHGLPENAFWIKASDAQGRTVGLQAFRLDHAEPSLALWALGWMLDHYARRREEVMPRAECPSAQSPTRLIRGRVVYHGELWIDRQAKGCFPLFPRIGMLAALLTWQPEAIWALTRRSMVERGHMQKMGYGHVEPGFIHWEREPQGAAPEEWIGIASRHNLEASLTTAKSQPSPIR